MAIAQRTAAEPVVAQLLRNPRRYDFYQAVRILEASLEDTTLGDLAAGSGLESIRFRSNPSLGFPSAEIDSAEALDDATRPAPRYQVTVNFMGLCGVSSPLPTFYTEDVIQLDADSDSQAHRDLYDFFNHRLIALLYCIWLKYRYYIQYRRQATDALSSWLCGLARLDDALKLPGLSGRGRPSLLPCLGLLLMRSISPSTLARILSFYFYGVPIKIIEGVERYVVIEQEQLCELGQANSTLGEDCVVGDRVRDVGGEFRVCVGPLDFEAFTGFLPGRPGLNALRDLTAFAVRDPLNFEVELKLLQKEIPALTLDPHCPCELGWSTWLEPACDDGVLVISRSEMQIPAFRNGWSWVGQEPFEEQRSDGLRAPMT